MKKIKIAIQGELGAYSHIAANNLFENAEITLAENMDDANFEKFLKLKKDSLLKDS